MPLSELETLLTKLRPHVSDDSSIQYEEVKVENDQQIVNTDYISEIQSESQTSVERGLENELFQSILQAGLDKKEANAFHEYQAAILKEIYVIDKDES